MRLLFTSAIVIIAAIPLSVWLAGGVLSLWTIVAAVVALFLVILIWRRVVRPIRLAETGLQLLESGEWNNRLVPPWFPEAQTVVNVYNDILSRLSEESRSLEERNNLLSLLVEASPTGIAMMDFDGRITMANTAFLSLAKVSSFKQIKGKRPDEIDSDLIRRAANVSVGRSDVVRMSDLQIVRCRHLWFMEKGFRKPFLLLEPLTDEVRKTERESYRKIIRTISHELNNSLMGVNTFLETVAADDSLPDDYKEVASGCLERNNDLAAFVGSYADIARLPSPLLKSVDLRKMLLDMVPFLQQLGGGETEIIVNPPKAPLMIECDVVMMQQVIINIVKNGIESTAGQPIRQIDIKAFGEKGSCVIEIADTGKGIATELAEKLFTPFFSTKTGGQGLGLTLASEVLDAHHAKYSFITVR